MAVEHSNLTIKNAQRSSVANLTEHHRVISLAAPVLQEAAAVLEREVQSPHASHHHHY